MPLYALRTRKSPVCGDYTALGSLADRAASAGGKIVATLPLLPTFLDEPFDPSPYAPVSRLLWNEFYIDLDNVPELASSARARELLQSSSILLQIGGLREVPLVDYRRMMAIKRRVLEECCRQLVTGKPGWFQDFQAFVRDHPVVEDYAAFRAAMEKQKSPWPSWPQRMRDGVLEYGDYEERTRLYYMYAQWLAHQQVKDLADRACRRGVSLYFDLPLGTHPQGYDVWRERDVFALNASAGSPPDTVYTGGQDWGFPPLLPEKIREQGYRYVINYVRHHLEHAGMLRIDHVMGLHRLFWIPKGLEASQGAYVSYRAEELLAILALESHRHRCVIVGEDLGTVPAYVRQSMSRHGLNRMYVLHYELVEDASGRLRSPRRNMVASLNTHDMPPFSAFWQGLDIPERLNLRLVDERGAKAEKRARRAIKRALLSFLRRKGWLKDTSTDDRTIFRACLAFLSASRARLVLVNLEDLWLETRSQNVPSTDDRNPNWRRKARYTLDEFCRLPEVRDTLKEIDRLRRFGKK
jgi:4-alpha-glucanotransferase